MSIRVLLADDHEVVRYGMSLVLDGLPDISVVGEASCGPEVLSLCEQLHPDLILLDLAMPGLSGSSLITELRKQHPALRILVLSMYKDGGHVLSALRAGASGYVLKENQTEEIVRAIREVAAGRKYLSPVLAEQALDSYVNGRGATGRARLEELTNRETEVIRLAADGMTSAVIASQLFISVRTAETHRSRAMQKLGLHNQVELVRFFVDLELSEPDV